MQNFNSIKKNFVNGNKKDAAEQFFNLSDYDKASFVEGSSQKEVSEMLRSFYMIGDQRTIRLTNFDLYQKAWDTWGDLPQQAVTAEELSEASAAISRIIRGRQQPSPQPVVTEIADAYIVLDSFVHRYNLTSWVKSEIESKIARLSQILKGEPNVS